jgi:hypothetical protein
MARNARAARSRTGIGSPTFNFEQMLDEIGDVDSRTQRVAYYLNWAAGHLAYQYQPYNVIARAISGSKSARLPRMDSDEVLGIRRTLHGIRKALRLKYNRSLDVVADGARATVDSQDVAAVVIPKKVRRLRTMKDSLVEEHKLINPAEIRDARIRAYIQRPIRDLMKILGSEDFDKKLLPPSGGGEKEPT